MTNYKCKNGHTFIHPAKQVFNIDFPIQARLNLIIANLEELYDIKKHPIEPENYKEIVYAVKALSDITDNTPDYFDMEVHVCPFCNSKEYEEVKEVDTAVQNVYIYELGTGPQTALDALLADGYVIVNRYSKQYHLEKPKPQETQQ